MNDYAKSEASIIAQKVPDARKRELLAALSEDDFRDQVIRPLYRRQGARHLRDTCGADERGKDCLFTVSDPLDDSPMLIAVQTKRGAITMAGTSPKQNLANIETQLRMCLDVPELLDDNATKLKPAQAHLCSSGPIANSARQHLYEKLEAHRIKLYGVDELIEKIDALYPEYWLGIDADRFPYVRELRKRLCLAEDVIKITDLAGTPGADSPVLDENYFRLRLSRMEEGTEVKATKIPVKHGRPMLVHQKQPKPQFVDIAVEAIPEQRHKLALITGEGGSGKTTALRRLAITLIDKVLAGSQDVHIPVVLKAKQVAASGKPITELVAEETTSISGGQSPLSVEDLEQGRVAVLVDALEEVGDENDEHKERERTLTLLLEFHAKYPECIVVITSRDYRSILELTDIGRFVHYFILPIALKEADGLITRVIEKNSVEKDFVRTTLKRLNETYGMSLSPMLITVFLSSSDYTKQDLPPNIAEIFKKFTEQMIGRWDEKKGLHQQYEANTKDYLLRQLAFNMHVQNVRSIPIDDVRAMFSSLLGKRDLQVNADDVFDEIVNRSGLLRTDGKVVEWRHHLLQEYFAGRGVPNGEFFERVVHDEWWRTPMVFHFGDKPESFADLWRVVESTGTLSLAELFDAAITIGLAVQACYLAEAQHKVSTIRWVIEAFAKSMDDFKRAIDGREGGGKELMALCAMLALGRDAIASRTLAKVGTDIVAKSVNSDTLFKPVDPERVEAWRLVGLLEAGEFDMAIAGLKTFRPANRDLIFMVHLSVAWAMYYQDVQGEHKKQLEKYRAATGELVEDMRQELLKELRSLFFQMRGGKLTAVVVESKAETTSTEQAPLEMPGAASV